MNVQGQSSYHEVYARSLADPQAFWAEAAKEIDWIEPPKTIFDAAQGVYEELAVHPTPPCSKTILKPVVAVARAGSAGSSRWDATPCALSR